MASRRALLLIALLGGGCGKESTAQLLENLKAPEALTRLKAVRTLPQRHEDAAEIVPALIEALKDKEADVRRGAALGLGSFGAQARDALPALQASLLDGDPSVRKAAALAQSYIDPARFPRPAKTQR